MYIYIYTYITLHYITLHCITLHYITSHYITLHCIALHYITSHYITLHTYILTEYMCIYIYIVYPYHMCMYERYRELYRHDMYSLDTEWHPFSALALNVPAERSSSPVKSPVEHSHKKSLCESVFKMVHTR